MDETEPRFFDVTLADSCARDSRGKPTAKRGLVTDSPTQLGSAQIFKLVIRVIVY